MNDGLDGDGNVILLPRPWLAPAVGEVRERGPLTIWTSAGRTYVKGRLGSKTLAYWHRILPALRQPATPATPM